MVAEKNPKYSKINEKDEHPHSCGKIKLPRSYLSTERYGSWYVLLSNNDVHHYGAANFNPYSDEVDVYPTESQRHYHCTII